MRTLFSLILFLLMFGGFVTAVIYLVIKTFTGAGPLPGSRQWDVLIQRMREKIKPRRATLIPWDVEMFQLLSLRNLANARKKWWGGSDAEGTLTTIYQEPVVLYEKSGTGKISLLLAQTSDREFVFRQKDRETEIWLNGRPLGVLAGNVLLEPGKGSRMIAKLERSADAAHFPLLLGADTSATLTNPQKPGATPNPRAITLLRALSPEEENVVLALAILNAVSPNGSR